nr:MAG TPA: hypothetical protein [Bacteriophage sp.]
MFHTFFVVITIYHIAKFTYYREYQLYRLAFSSIFFIIVC